MKVLILDKREVCDVNPSWGSRLIEQGIAILPPVEPPKEAEPEGEQPEEKPAKKASKK